MPEALLKNGMSLASSHGSVLQYQPCSKGPSAYEGVLKHDHIIVQLGNMIMVMFGVLVRHI